MRGALVTAQIALSLALLVLSGLFVRGAAAGASADPGFALEPLVVAQLDPRLGGYDEREEPRDPAAPSSSGCAPLPGIDAASAATVLPFGDYSMGAVVQREGPRLKNEDPEAKGKISHALEYVISAGLFQDAGPADAARP